MSEARAGTIEQYLILAMEEAEAAAAAGDHPYGAIIVDAAGAVVATGRNGVNTDLDPSSHGEMNAVRAACRALRTNSLQGYRLFTNGAPCTMCATVMISVGLDEIWYAAPPNPGRTMPTVEELVERSSGFRPKVTQGLLQEEASAQLTRLTKS